MTGDGIFALSRLKHGFDSRRGHHQTTIVWPSHDHTLYFSAGQLLAMALASLRMRPCAERASAVG